MRSASLSLPVPISERDRRRSSSRPAGTGAQPNEYSALLPGGDGSGETTLQNSVADDRLPEGGGIDKAEPVPVLTEFWILLRGSLPVIVAYALQNSLQTASVLIVGR